VNTWHATSEELAVYRYGEGDPAMTASVEAHLLACPDCRRSLAGVGESQGSAETQRRWSELAERLDAPRSTTLSRITVSTRPLLSAGLLAMVLVIVLPLFPMVIVGLGVPNALLAMAPLAPIAAVALSYRSSADPAGELAAAAPMAGLRLVAGRALAVSLMAAPLGVVVGLLMRFPTEMAFAWLLPGLALSSLVLFAGTTRLDPTVVACTLGVGWPVLVAFPSVSGEVPASLVASWIAGSSGQLLMVAVAVLALVASAVRRDRVAYRRTS
jgi:hypothetical protein